MYRQPLPRLILAALLSLSALPALAEHKDVLPLSAEVVTAVRAAQQGQADPMAAALDRHLHEGLELAGRGELAAAQLRKKGLKASDIQSTLASRQGEAAAKRQEMLGLRDEVLARLEHEAAALTA